MDEPLVFLGMPRHNSAINMHVAECFFRYTSRSVRVTGAVTQNSLLCHSFNQHWAAARDASKECTHFAMQHADILPERWWIDTMLQELLDHDADLISAVVPIKSDEGLTSTAIGTDDPWDSRRLTMHEIYELPETFSSEDVGGPLLVNTGLWMCDLRKPWVHELHFESKDRIVQRDGISVAQVIPEDWLFSQRLHERGAKIVATRRIGVRHMGDERAYSNERPWGLWKTDARYEERTLQLAGV